MTFEIVFVGFSIDICYIVFVDMRFSFCFRTLDEYSDFVLRVMAFYHFLMTLFILFVSISAFNLIALTWAFYWSLSIAAQSFYITLKYFLLFLLTFASLALVIFLLLVLHDASSSQSFSELPADNIFAYSS